MKCRRRRRLTVILLIAGCSLSQGATGQEDSFHWAYAAWFGTGRYSLDGSTETAVLSYAPGWTWREPAISDAGRRSPGYRFRLPIAIGAHELPEFGQLDELSLGSVTAISIVPGVEIVFPLSARWRLKSLGYLGFGTETGGGTDARIYRLGLRSQLRFMPGNTEILLVNGIGRMGYASGDDIADRINLLVNGLDFRRQLRERKIGGAPLSIHWHVMHTRYLDSVSLNLSRFSARPATLGGEWELGVAFSKQPGRLGWWKLRFDRVGIAYRFGADGKFSAVGIVFKALFDR